MSEQGHNEIKSIDKDQSQHGSIENRMKQYEICIDQFNKYRERIQNAGIRDLSLVMLTVFPTFIIAMERLSPKDWFLLIFALSAFNATILRIRYLSLKKNELYSFFLANRLMEIEYELGLPILPWSKQYRGFNEKVTEETTNIENSSYSINDAIIFLSKTKEKDEFNYSFNKELLKMYRLIEKGLWMVVFATLMGILWVVFLEGFRNNFNLLHNNFNDTTLVFILILMLIIVSVMAIFSFIYIYKKVTNPENQDNKRRLNQSRKIPHIDGEKALAVVVILIILGYIAYSNITQNEDYDGDGIRGNNDIDEYNDVVIALTVTNYLLHDNSEFAFDSEIWLEVEFSAGIFSKEQKSTPIQGNIEKEKNYQIDYTFIFNQPDNKENVDITVKMFEDDRVFDDQFDISPTKSKELKIKYDFHKNTWSGDITGKQSSGLNDGNDHEDATIWIEIFETSGQTYLLTDLYNEFIIVENISNGDYSGLADIYNSNANDFENTFTSTIANDVRTYIENNGNIESIVHKTFKEKDPAYTSFLIALYFLNIFLDEITV